MRTITEARDGGLIEAIYFSIWYSGSCSSPFNIIDSDRVHEALHAKFGIKSSS